MDSFFPTHFPQAFKDSLAWLAGQAERLLFPTNRAGLVIAPSQLQLPEWTVYRKNRQLIYSGYFPLYNANGQVYSGIFGRIVVHGGSDVEIYIHNPPAALRKLPEGACFQLLRPSSRWFRLHWHRPAASFEEGLAYMDGLMRRTGLPG